MGSRMCALALVAGLLGHRGGVAAGRSRRSGPLGLPTLRAALESRVAAPLFSAIAPLSAMRCDAMRNVPAVSPRGAQRPALPSVSPDRSKIAAHRPIRLRTRSAARSPGPWRITSIERRPAATTASSLQNASGPSVDRAVAQGEVRERQTLADATEKGERAEGEGPRRDATPAEVGPACCRPGLTLNALLPSIRS